MREGKQRRWVRRRKATERAESKEMQRMEVWVRDGEVEKVIRAEKTSGMSAQWRYEIVCGRMSGGRCDRRWRWWWGGGELKISLVNKNGRGDECGEGH